jgi:hypothetical protein
MYINSLKTIYERIRNKVTDSLLCNKKYYVIYFGCVILGALIGYLFGKDLPYNYNIEIDNVVSSILYKKANVFCVFKRDLLLFILLYAIFVFSVVCKPLRIALFFIVSFIVFRAIRHTTCLIILGGLENVFGAILFYLIYYTLFVVLLSYTVVKIINYTNCCPVKLTDAISKVSPSYLFCVTLITIYGVLICLILSIFSI